MTLFNRIIIEDLLITGSQNDTLIQSNKIAVYVSLPHLLHKEIRVNRVNINGGCFNFVSEERGKSNLNTIFRISPTKKEKKSEWPFLTIKEIRISSFNFRYSNLYNKKNVHPGCMDYAGLDVSGINLRIHDVKTRPKKGITAKIDYLQAHEKCGLSVENLSCNFSLDKNLTVMEDLKLKDRYSDVKAEHLSFQYESGKDLADFVNKIVMDAHFDNALLDFRTIGYFAYTLQTNSLQLLLNGDVHGPVADLSSEMLHVETKDGVTDIQIAFSLKGLPDIIDSDIDANIHSLHSTTKEVDEIIAHFSNKKDPILTPILHHAEIDLYTTYSGKIGDFKAKGELNSTIGGVKYDITGGIGDKESGVKLNGSISTKELNIGKIIGNESVGGLTAKIDANLLLKGGEEKGSAITIDTLTIDKFRFNDYDYRDIFAIGEFIDGRFDGRILSHDPNCHFMIQGVANLSTLKGDNVIDLYADIPFIDLSALNLLKGEEKGQLSLRTTAKMVKEHDHILGNVDILNVTYWGAKEYNFNSISLSSNLYDNLYVIDIDAPFIEARYESTQSPTSIISRATNLLVYDRFPSSFKKGEKSNTNKDEQKGDATLHIKTFNTEDICEILLPELYVADNTFIDFSLNSDDSLKVSMKSDRLALGKNFIKGMEIDITNPDPLLNFTLAGEAISFSDIELNRGNITLSSKNEEVAMRVAFDNMGSSNSDMELLSNITFERDSANALNTSISFLDSYINLQGLKWDIPTSKVSIGGKNFRFDNFRIIKGDQSIALNGAISQDSKDSINLSLNSFELANIEHFIKNKINLKGILSGEVTASSLFQNPNILMDIKAKEISLKGGNYGDLHVLSKWDQNNKRMNLLVMNGNNGVHPLTLSGFYDPEGKYVNMNINLKEFGLAIIEPFLQSSLKDIGGSITGSLTLSGPTNNLNLLGDNTTVKNFSFTPLFTNVPYTLNGSLDFKRDGILFNQLLVHDNFQNRATLNGALRHTSFKNIYLDASLGFNNLQCLNTYDGDNSSFYGSAFASGVINLTGPFNDLFADVTVTTDPKTAIHVPLSSSASAKSEDLLSFKSMETITIDPYLERIKKSAIKKQEISKSKFTLQAKASITSDAELFIEINKQLGDILKCRGNGVVDIDVDPARGTLDLKGDYTIEEGSYKFVLLGITAKDFIIDNGGSINFNGDVKNTTLNVGATYQTKASISTLIADTSAVGNRRTVDCGIKMSGSLNDPNISFSIDVQDLDPITKGRVEGALSTDDKIQKQFMALLISGSFVPDEQSGIVNNTTILYSNAGEMLSNQFNNVFRQLDIPLDLGLNFQPAADGKTHDIFDVALSYQAFNNRVVINGNVGNSQASQAWGGDFEAEIKIDQKGKMRLKAFTRSADDYSNYLDNTQRHGVGFTYQDEFDTFKELVRNIFWSKKRREEYETKLILDAEQAIIEEEKANTHKKVIQQAKESPF